MVAFLVLRGIPPVLVSAAAAAAIPASALGSSAAVCLARRSGTDQFSGSVQLKQSGKHGQSGKDLDILLYGGEICHLEQIPYC